jgi:hypothetical protein
MRPLWTLVLNDESACHRLLISCLKWEDETRTSPVLHPSLRLFPGVTATRPLAFCLLLRFMRHQTAWEDGAVAAGLLSIFMDGVLMVGGGGFACRRGPLMERVSYKNGEISFFFFLLHMGIEGSVAHN